jgi:N-acetylglucosamine transport system permease protein
MAVLTTTRRPPDTASVPADRARRTPVLSHAFLVGWALLTTLPLVWAVLSSFKTDTEILTDRCASTTGPAPGARPTSGGIS